MLSEINSDLQYGDKLRLLLGMNIKNVVVRNTNSCNSVTNNISMKFKTNSGKFIYYKLLVHRKNKLKNITDLSQWEKKREIFGLVMINYQTLKKITIKDHYPTIDELVIFTIKYRRFRMFIRTFTSFWKRPQINGSRNF